MQGKEEVKREKSPTKAASDKVIHNIIDKITITEAFNKYLHFSLSNLSKNDTKELQLVYNKIHEFFITAVYFNNMRAITEIFIFIKESAENAENAIKKFINTPLKIIKQLCILLLRG